MSYTKDKQKFVKRRHPTQKVTPQELLVIHNRQVDDCNNRIAQVAGTAQHWFEVAQALGEENLMLRRALEETARAKTLGDVRGIVNRVRRDGI